MASILTYNFVLSLAGVIMLFAAGSDALRFRIPNAAVLALILLFPIFVYVAPFTVRWPSHLLVFALLFVLGYGLYLKNLAGAGDIKLISAVGLWAGPDYWGHFLFITAISGGILGLTIAVITLVRQHLSKTEDQKNITKTPIPYGVAIALGGLCSLALLSHPDLLPTKG